jgi:DNA (cytosine-5)-methyltransferase 1
VVGNVPILKENFRIRKLTAKETWRLMSFADEDFEKAKNALNNTYYKGKDKSSSQLYKQARKQHCCKSFRKNI